MVRRGDGQVRAARPESGRIAPTRHDLLFNPLLYNYHQINSTPRRAMQGNGLKSLILMMKSD